MAQRTLGEMVTYAEVTRFDGGLDSWEKDGEGEMGRGCEGIFKEECAPRIGAKTSRKE